MGEDLIEVRLTPGEARALIGAQEPESVVGDYPYHLLGRAQMTIQLATEGRPRVPNTDDSRPPPPDGPRLVINIDLPRVE